MDPGQDAVDDGTARSRPAASRRRRTTGVAGGAPAAASDGVIEPRAYWQRA